MLTHTRAKGWVDLHSLGLQALSPVLDQAAADLPDSRQVHGDTEQAADLATTAKGEGEIDA